jgi:toxin secretion/phage lysis holin
MTFIKLKNIALAIIGAMGSAVSALFGGWNAALGTLLIFMAVDYITGVIVAGVFHRSSKTVTGALESRAGWKGLLRKGVTLLVVLVAARLDILLKTAFVRDGVVVAYIANETLSIVENAGLMGIPVPEPVKNAIEALKGGIGK